MDARPDGLRVELRTPEESLAGEYKWLLFTEGKRGSVGKLLAEVADPAAKECFVKSISLKPTLRGHGTGSWLLSQCVDYMRDQVGCGAVALEAEEDMSRFGKLVALYEAAGFRQEGKGQCKLMYNGDETFRVVPMRLELALDAWRLSLAFARAMAAEALARDRLPEVTLWDAVDRCGLAQAVAAMARAVAMDQPEWVQFLCLVHRVGAMQRQCAWQSHPAGRACDDLPSVWLAQVEAAAGVDLPVAAAAAPAAGAAESQGQVERGLEQLQPVWNDDEYLSRLLEKNQCVLPRLAGPMVRFRRMRRLLEGGAYDALLESGDKATIGWVARFADLLEAPMDAQEPSEENVRRAERLVRKFAPSGWAW